MLVGCQANSPSPQSTVKAPELPAPPPAAVTPGETPSALSYGTATQVKKGVTTQMEIMEKFGGPDVMTTDKDGIEVWMYDKTTSTVTSNNAQSGSQAIHSEASAMAGYLGIPAIAGVTGAKNTVDGQSAQVSQGTGKVERTAKTITFIIKFNPDKTVKDYAVRQSKY
ncbi:MAG: hypothetical protein WAX69_22670 [Victivallales bacterium]